MKMNGLWTMYIKLINQVYYIRTKMQRKKYIKQQNI